MPNLKINSYVTVSSENKNWKYNIGIVFCRNRIFILSKSGMSSSILNLLRNYIFHHEICWLRNHIFYWWIFRFSGNQNSTWWIKIEILYVKKHEHKHTDFKNYLIINNNYYTNILCNTTLFYFGFRHLDRTCTRKHWGTDVRWIVVVWCEKNSLYIKPAIARQCSCCALNI